MPIHTLWSFFFFCLLFMGNLLLTLFYIFFIQTRWLCSPRPPGRLKKLILVYWERMVWCKSFSFSWSLVTCSDYWLHHFQMNWVNRLADISIDHRTDGSVSSPFHRFLFEHIVRRVKHLRIAISPAQTQLWRCLRTHSVQLPRQIHLVHL